MKSILQEKVICNEQIAKDIFKLTLESKTISQNCIPGQFVNIKCNDGYVAYLRRPISICDIDKTKQTVDLIYQVRGKGTKYLSELEPDRMLDIMGPLGKGFDISKKYNNIAVIGGGIGIFPLLYLLKQLNADIKHTYIGFRTEQLIVLEKEFNEASDKVYLATDDGTKGYAGFVTDILKENMETNQYDMIFTCGPYGMMEITARLAKSKGTLCQVSLEERMGCGIGACLVCACKHYSKEEQEFLHVCKDGPVFYSTEVMDI